MKKYLPRVILYPHRQKDRDIMEWLSKLSPGFKSQAIKDAIWASLSGTAPPLSVSKEPPVSESRRISTTSTMRAEVTFDTHELLADIRQIVEVGVTSALGHLSTKENQPLVRENEKEIEAMLDDLDISFMLDDDDEEEL